MHQQWLLRTLDLAKAHKGACAPNPAVGAIVVKDGQELSHGSHIKAGEAHAEFQALSKLEYPLTDAVLYVSLEPCSHWGKTPPCVEEIVRSGISKVVFSYSDPNPIMASFDTIGYLKEKGITCEQVQLDEITQFYQSYHHWMRHKKPLITVKLAQSLNGKIALAGNQPFALTSKAINQFTHQQRLQSDAILTTATTIIADDPKLNVRLESESEINKPVAILDRQLRLTAEHQLFQSDAPKVIFHGDMAVKSELPMCRYIQVPESELGLALPEVIKELGKLGWHDVWVEAGSALFMSLLKQELVNRVLLYISPCWLPDDAVELYKLNELFSPDRIENIHWQVFDNDVMASFTVLPKREIKCSQA